MQVTTKGLTKHHAGNTRYSHAPTSLPSKFHSILVALSVRAVLLNKSAARFELLRARLMRRGTSSTNARPRPVRASPAHPPMSSESYSASQIQDLCIIPSHLRNQKDHLAPSSHVPLPHASSQIPLPHIAIPSLQPIRPPSHPHGPCPFRDRPGSFDSGQPPSALQGQQLRPPHGCATATRRHIAVAPQPSG